MLKEAEKREAESAIELLEAEGKTLYNLSIHLSVLSSMMEYSPEGRDLKRLYNETEERRSDVRGAIHKLREMM